MLFELSLPSCDTVPFNAKVRFTDSYSDNNVVSLCCYLDVLICVPVYINFYFSFFFIHFILMIFPMDLVV